MYRQINREMLDFIDASPCASFAVDNLRTRLISEGYLELCENELWGVLPGGKYFLTRSGGSLIAFRVPSDRISSYHAVLSHSDCPSLKLKPDFEQDIGGAKKLLVEKYGGAILDSFFDIPLGVAGIVVVSTSDGIIKKSVNLENVCIIPRTPPHLSKEQTTNPATDMCPVYSFGSSLGLRERIASELQVEEEDILSHDLYLYPCGKGILWGEKSEFVTSRALDNLQSVFASLAGFLNSDESSSVPVMAVFDNEEIGSGGDEGAGSSFLADTLWRISVSLGKTEEEHKTLLANSFFISSDAAHARHPNHPELFDSENSPVINKGIAIKYNAQKRYTTTAVSAALFSQIAKMAQVPCQIYANRSDIAGGSTLGHISQSQVSAITVDIGAPMLAMHSSRETVGALDTEYLVRVFEMFYSVYLERVENGYNIK